MSRSFKFIILLFVTLYLLSSSFFIVSEKQFAKVFTFNTEVSRVIRQPGLHWKLPAPFQTVQYVDARIVSLSKAQPDIMQTKDKKNLLVDYYIRWRVADPLVFHRSFPGQSESSSIVHERLLVRVTDALTRAVNNHETSSIISEDRGTIQNSVLSPENRKVFLKDFGIDLVDVRIRRVEFQPEILESVFLRMSTERSIAARESRARGEADKSESMAEGHRESDVILATANAQSLRIRGEGDAQAAAIYAKAYQQDPEFFKFYRSLQAYKESFNTEKDTLVLDSASEFFRFMRGSGK